MRCKTKAAVPQSYYRDIYRYVMECKVVTLGKLFDVDMRMIRRYLMKVCEKLGYRGIRTYHFRKLYSVSYTHLDVYKRQVFLWSQYSAMNALQIKKDWRDDK